MRRLNRALVSATNVSQFAQPKKQHGQQCVCNNVSSFATTFTFGWVFIRKGKLFIRRVRKRKITRTVCLVKQNKLFFVYDLYYWTQTKHFVGFLKWCHGYFCGKEMPKNHTDNERFAAASSCNETEILTLLFPRKRRRSSPSPFISHRVLEAVASRISDLYGEAPLKGATSGWYFKRVAIFRKEQGKLSIGYKRPFQNTSNKTT